MGRDGNEKFGSLRRYGAWNEDEPATFLVAATGEAMAKRDVAAGTPEARASREDRQRGRAQTAQSDGAPRASKTREKRPKASAPEVVEVFAQSGTIG
jgi:hypothetical protein